MSINREDLVCRQPSKQCKQDNPSFHSRKLALNANADLQDSHGRSALIYAVREGCAKVVKQLLAKTSVDLLARQDKDKMNAFDYAGSSPDGASEAAGSSAGRAPSTCPAVT